MSDFLNWELTNRMHNLGYDGKTLMYIDDEEDIINDDSAELIGAKPAILTSAAFRWFREKYGYLVGPFQNEDNLFFFEIGKLNSLTTEYYSPDCNTYEEAELACLDMLIEIVESKQKEDGK